MKKKNLLQAFWHWFVNSDRGGMVLFLVVGAIICLLIQHFFYKG